MISLSVRLIVDLKLPGAIIDIKVFNGVPSVAGGR